MSVRLTPAYTPDMADVNRVFITLKPTMTEKRIRKIYDTLEILDKINTHNRETVNQDDISAMILKKQLIAELNSLKNKPKPHNNKTPTHTTKGFEVRASGRKKKPRTKKKPLDTKGKTAKPKRNKTKGKSKRRSKK
tara:strand:+ start:3176 stop:3583 length:408 start_codon:yes stop_codon:yes gene_type:complete